MNDVITAVWVPGHPKTKGSLDSLGNGRMVENVKGSEDWRVLVARMIRQDLLHRHSVEPYVGPVAVRCTFFLESPWGPVADVFASTATATWSRAGDVDKLARNVLDACAADAKEAAKNGGAYQNDNQVVRLISTKVASDGRPGDSGLALVVAIMTPDMIAEEQRQARAMRLAIQANRL